MIDGIISRRACDNRPFFQVCFEWEDEFAKALNVKIIPLTPMKTVIKRINRKVAPSFYRMSQDLSKSCKIYFVMFVGELIFYSGINGIPIFIDVWEETEFKLLIEKMKGFKLYYVTSLDVYHRIKKMEPESNVHYMPLSVPDQYYSENFEKYCDKTIDVIQMGRKNRLLHQWMLQYSSLHSNVEYFYSEQTSNDSDLVYVSTKGRQLEGLGCRTEFIKTLGSARISLVSSPNADGSRSNANGIDYPTPRFYESAALGCSIVGRYGDHEEFSQLHLSDYCPNVQDYDSFAAAIDRGLQIERTVLFKQNQGFITQNLTSMRAKQVLQDMKKTWQM